PGAASRTRNRTDRETWRRSKRSAPDGWRAASAPAARHGPGALRARTRSRRTRRRPPRRTPAPPGPGGRESETSRQRHGEERFLERRLIADGTIPRVSRLERQARVPEQRIVRLPVQPEHVAPVAERLGQRPGRAEPPRAVLGPGAEVDVPLGGGARVLRERQRCGRGDAESP